MRSASSPVWKPSRRGCAEGVRRGGRIVRRRRPVPHRRRHARSADRRDGARRHRSRCRHHGDAPTWRPMRRPALSTAATSGALDAVAIGSPHLSLAEFAALERLIAGRRLSVPIHACTGRHVVAELDKTGRRKALEALGVVVVADTCVVVTPILPGQDRRRADDQFGKIRPLCAGQYRLCRALRLACRLRRKRCRRQAGVFGSRAMTEAIRAEVLVEGTAGTGEALVLSAPISFWGGVDPQSGRIVDVRHPQCGESVCGTRAVRSGDHRLILGVGGAAGTRAQRPCAGGAGAARGRRDSLLLGLIVAREMGWQGPVAVKQDHDRFIQFRGRWVEVGADGRIRALEAGLAMTRSEGVSFSVAQHPGAPCRPIRQKPSCPRHRCPPG